MKKLTSILLALLLVITLAPTAAADENAKFNYDLRLTDQNGTVVEDPRTLAEGDILNVEIVLERKEFTGSYEIFGLEFRLMTTGLQYNKDGTTLRRGTDVTERTFSDGTSVGFAWYDLLQQPETVYNPTLAAKWSYTVTDPTVVNIRIPVALVYLAGQTDAAQPTGNARLELKPIGAQNFRDTVSGAYSSGTVVTLPEPEQMGYDFLGWDDGAVLHPAGSEYTLSGVVTLVARWEEKERNCHLSLDANGGAMIGDITGHYADGVVVLLPPPPQREGYRFLGWSDGQNFFPAGAHFTILGNVQLTAQWEVDTGENPGLLDIFEGILDNLTLPGWVGPLVFWSVILLLLAGALWLIRWLLLLLPLWKRDYVEYSLQSGNMTLNFTNEERRFQVSVVLDDNGRKQTLGKSPMLEAGTHLQFIANTEGLPIVRRKPGIYKGKLVIQGEGWFKINDCNIKITDQELEEEGETAE